MRRGIKSILVLGICLSFLTSGCIGQMAMVKKVANINLELSEDRWEREIIFVLFMWFPIYGFSALADIIVFNSLEFWTGRNPITNEPSISPVSQLRTFEVDGTSLAMRLRDDQSIDVEAIRPDGERIFLNLIRTDQGIVARDQAGRVLTRAPGANAQLARSIAAYPRL
jgi:hypothetical protein